jgi:hypothetical protein
MTPLRNPSSPLCTCLRMRAHALRSAPSTTRGWLAARRPETPACLGGHSRARVPRSRVRPEGLATHGLGSGSDREAGCSLTNALAGRLRDCPELGSVWLAEADVRFRNAAPASLSAEWPTSRPCSADESVATPHRFQRVDRPILPWVFVPSKVLLRPPRLRMLPLGCGLVRRSASGPHMRWRHPSSGWYVSGARQAAPRSLPLQSLSGLGAAIPPPVLRSPGGSRGVGARCR